MVDNYNPFERLSESLVRELLKEGRKYFVVQRFAWPGYEPATTFISSAYKDELDAREHAEQLGDKEGKLINGSLEVERIANLIHNNKIQVFHCTFLHVNWDKRVLDAYRPSIIGYISLKTTFRRKDVLNVELYFEWGRLRARLISGQQQCDIPAIDLLNR
jgi:hypothetical protein